MREAERRKQPRVAVRLPLQLMLQDSKISTEIEDLSNSGIRFRTPAALPLMSRVQISLELPAGAKERIYVSATGVVVRSDAAPRGGPHRFETAIFFEDITEASRLQISRFVQTRMGK